MYFRHNFVPLQIVMKSLITKMFAALLVVWYLVGIIGFGVHTCNGSGKSFIVSFAEGLSCEDVHPEHHCSKGSCCTHLQKCCDSGATSLSSKPCCSSEYQVLALTGTLSTEKNADDGQISFIFHHFVYADMSDCKAVLSSPQSISHRISACSCPGAIPDRQAVLNVWRI